MKTEWNIDDTRDGVTFRLLMEGETLGTAEIKSKGPAKPKAVWMMGAHLARVGSSWSAQLLEGAERVAEDLGFGAAGEEA